MKKVFLGLFILVALALAFLYIIIPGKIVISQSVKVQANRNALVRKLQFGEDWKKWWPGTETTDSSVTFMLNGIRFKPGPPKALSVPLQINASDFETSCELTFISTKIDSTTLHIESTVDIPFNPFKRVGVYLESKKLEKNIVKILESINETYSKVQNLYSYNIQKEKVVDSTLVFTYEEVKGYPSVDKVYALIDKLKDYIKRNDAAETGFPMQNIFTADNNNYLLKVAIPVNKRLPDSGRISYKWMLGGGNILITEVKGGPHEINNALKQIQNYISDYERIAPAISFESLVTDRRLEPDSSKWITRIYYPVM